MKTSNVWETLSFVDIKQVLGADSELKNQWLDLCAGEEIPRIGW